MFKLENLDVVGGMLQQWFLPIIIPAILFVAGLTSWAYLVSKGKMMLKKYWFIPVGFLIVALIVAIIFHRWGKANY